MSILVDFVKLNVEFLPSVCVLEGQRLPKQKMFWIHLEVNRYMYVLLDTIQFVLIALK